jgi:ABC-type polysaccharide/polyol phosphate export permease
MSATAIPARGIALRRPRVVRRTGAFLTLVRRRMALTARNPRQVAIPLLTPILFATVIAPALTKSLGALKGNIDYTAFVSVGTVGLLVPLAAMLAGLSVIVDRHSGAQKELLAAPVPRPLLVLANVTVVLGLSALQVGVLIGVAALRGATFHLNSATVLWFPVAAILFTLFMYGVAETLASRIAQQEEYIGLTPVVAILPFFFAGSLFPIHALPGALAAFAKVLPLTHALALMRYGLVDPSGRGLHDIWGMSNVHAEAWLSLAVVLLFAGTFTALAIRMFTRSAVK